jgi:hypothetical protein
MGPPFRRIGVILPVPDRPVLDLAPRLRAMLRQ